jgi:osmotically-inducible protein OsmY
LTTKTRREESIVAFWVYPDQRYYYDWYDADGPGRLTDSDIKSTLVDRLNEDPFTSDMRIKVDVKQHVVVLGGDAPTTIAKRVAGDNAWDTPGVVDVSNQIQVMAAAR